MDLLDTKKAKNTACCILVDKEEIGSLAQLVPIPYYLKISSLSWRNYKNYDDFIHKLFWKKKIKDIIYPKI